MGLYIFCRTPYIKIKLCQVVGMTCHMTPSYPYPCPRVPTSQKQEVSFPSLNFSAKYTKEHTHITTIEIWYVRVLQIQSNWTYFTGLTELSILLILTTFAWIGPLG